MKTIRQRVAWGLAVTIVVTACGDTRPVFGGAGTTTDPTAAPVQEPGDLPEPAYVILDEEPDGPLTLTIGLQENPEGVERIEFLGDDLSTERPPETILVHFADEEDPLAFVFDDEGRPVQIVAPDGSQLRVLEYRGDQAVVLAVDTDGATSRTTVDVPAPEMGAFAAAPSTAGRSTAIQAVGAAHHVARGVTTAPTTITHSTSGGYSFRLPPGLDESDVLLRSDGCSLLWAGAEGTSNPASCTTLVGPEEFTTRTVIDLATLYGGTVPQTFYESRQECESSKVVTRGVGGLLLAGAFVTLVATGVGAVAIGTVAGFIGILGLGSASAFVTTVAGGSLLLISDSPCNESIVTNQDLRADVEQQLASSISIRPQLEPVVLRNPGRWQAEFLTEPGFIEPFAPTGPGRFDWVTVSVTPAEDAATTTTPATLDGTYVGAVTRYPEQDLIGIETSEVTVSVDDSSISGTERFVVVRSPDYGEYVEVEMEATQWVEFSGTIASDGTFRAPGLSYSSFRLLSCSGNQSNCSNVSAPTGNPDGFPVEVVGTIQDGVLTAEIIWPGNETGTYAIQAVRQG